MIAAEPVPAREQDVVALGEEGQPDVPDPAGSSRIEDAALEQPRSVVLKHVLEGGRAGLVRPDV